MMLLCPVWISPCAQNSSAALWWCVLPRLSPPRCGQPISTPHGSQRDSPMFPSRYPRLSSHVCTSPCTSGRGAHGTWLHPRAHQTVGLLGCGCRPCGVHVRATSVDAGPGGRKWTAVLPAQAPRCWEPSLATLHSGANMQIILNDWLTTQIPRVWRSTGGPPAPPSVCFLHQDFS